VWTKDANSDLSVRGDQKRPIREGGQAVVTRHLPTLERKPPRLKKEYSGLGSAQRKEQGGWQKGRVEDHPGGVTKLGGKQTTQGSPGTKRVTPTLPKVRKLEKRSNFPQKETTAQKRGKVSQKGLTKAPKIEKNLRL